MKFLPLFVVLLAVSYGCEPKDRQEVLDHGQVALNEAGNAMQVAWRSVADKARKIDLSSTDKDIQQARRQLSDAASKVSAGAKDQVAAMQAELQRLDAAKRLRDLKDAAEKAKQQVGDTYAKTKDQLDSTSKAYDELHAKLDQAQKAYDEASRKAEDAWKSVTK